MIVPQLSAFPNGRYSEWEGTPVQPGIKLTWQRVAGLFSECSRGNRLRQKPAILPKLRGFFILCCLSNL